MNNRLTAYYLIEGGRPLELVKHHIAERDRVRLANVAIADELGVQEGRFASWGECGVLTAVKFCGKPPEGWTKPDRHGCSRPKHGTEWAKRLDALKGWKDPSDIIREEFKVPCTMFYLTDGGEGSKTIGGFSPNGFLWASLEGPFAMYIPDVAGEIKLFEAETGYAVTEPDRNWELTAPGLRRIEKEEWTILANQKTLELRRAEREAAAAICAGDPA